MDWIVTTARTVEEAQSRALDLLGVDSADAEIQVIEEGKTGLFGRTKSEARVRARIKPKAPPAKEERRPSRGGDRNRGRGGGNNRGGNRDGGNKGGGGNNRGGGNKGGGGNNRGGNRDGGNRGGGRDGGNRDAETAGAAASGGGGGNRGGGRNRNRGGGRDGGNRDGGRQRNDRSSRNNEDRVEMPVDEQRETLQTFVAGVAKAFDNGSEVTLVEEGTTLQAQVAGSDLGRLIGNKASTLQALEELSRTAMHRAAAGRRYHRIQVDVDEYRARRREALAKFATDLAKSVADSGESKAMEPMGAADRKLIHDAVADVAGVETVSEGRDPRRYIVLLPSKAASDEEE